MTDRHSALLAAGEPDDLVFTLQRGHDAGVVATLRELLDRNLLDAEGALDILSTVVLDADGDVAADFAIDVQATQAHAGIDQPDWATPWGNYVDAHAFVPNTFDPRFCAVDDCGVRRNLHPDAKCVLCGLDLDGATDAAVIKQGWLCPDCFDAHDANPPANDGPSSR